MRTMIVDDEPLARSALRRLCAEQPGLTIIAEADSGAAAIEAALAHRPQLLLLDVDLQDMSGFEVLRSLAKQDELAAILITAHSQYAIHACEHESVDYLTKPVDPVRFGCAIDRVRQRLTSPSAALAQEVARQVRAALTEFSPSPHARLVGERGQRFYFLDVATIDYIVADGNYVIIHCAGERYISRNTVKHLSTTLQLHGFVRIERSLLLNLQRVAFVERLGQGEFCFVLRNGERLRSGRTHRKVIVQELRRCTLRDEER
jgi:two-component system LytT family response regulator